MRDRQLERLYNQIMSNISRKIRPIIESAINEDDDDIKSKVEKAADALISGVKNGKENLETVISTFENIMKKDPKNHYFYGGVPYEKLIPELKKRLTNKPLNAVNDSVNNRRRFRR